MGDIGFLLLIFFVILARAQDDSHIQWQPAKLADIKMAAAPLASVAIDSGFKIYLDGKEISPDELAAALTKRPRRHALRPTQRLPQSPQRGQSLPLRTRHRRHQ